jgi:hypothetical protein
MATVKRDKNRAFSKHRSRRTHGRSESKQAQELWCSDFGGRKWSRKIPRIGYLDGVGAPVQQEKNGGLGTQTSTFAFLNEKIFEKKTFIKKILLCWLDMGD